jgi:perosamine synthetase
VPIHQQTFYITELGYHINMPQTELAVQEVLSLPVHPALSQDDLETIVSAVNEFTGE